MSSLSVGNAIYISVKPLIKILLNCSIGYFLAKKGTFCFKPSSPIFFFSSLTLNPFLLTLGLLTPETCSNLSSIVVNVLQPCLMFSRIIACLDSSDLKTVGVIVLTGFLFQFLGMFASFVGRLFLKIPKYWTGSYILTCVFSNLTDLPVAYVTTLSGGSPFTEADGIKGTAYAMVFVSTFTFSMYSMGMYKMVIHDNRKKENAMKDGIYKRHDLSDPAIIQIIEYFQGMKKKSWFGKQFLNGNVDTKNNQHVNYDSNTTSPDSFDSENDTHPKSIQVTTSCSNLQDQEKNSFDLNVNSSPTKSSSLSRRRNSQRHCSNHLFDDETEPPVDVSDTVIVVYEDQIRNQRDLTNDNKTSNNTDSQPPPEVREIKEYTFRENNSRANLSLAERIQNDLKRAASNSTNQGLTSQFGNPTHGTEQLESTHLSGSSIKQVTTRASSFSYIAPHDNTEMYQTNSVSSHVIFPHNPAQQKDRMGSLEENGLDAQGLSSSSTKVSGSKPSFKQKFHNFINRHYILRVIVWPVFYDFMRPQSATLIVSLIVTMIPTLRALFYNGGTGVLANTIKGPSNIPNAPDGQPVLSFIMDLTTFVGASQVPFGMMLLGAGLSRLRFGALPKSFYGVILYLALFKLAVMPIITIIWTTYMRNIGWIDTSAPGTPKEMPMTGLMFILTSGSPIATLQVLFTSMFSKPIIEIVEEKDENGNVISTKEVYQHEELDYLAVCLIVQYGLLFLSMSILITYTLKNVLHV